MSSPRIPLVANEGSPLIRFVDAVGRLNVPGMPRHALMGGVAVMFRLAAAHRATADVDALVRETSGVTASELLVRSGATRIATGVEFAGVRIDILEVGDVPSIDELPEDPLDRAFVLAHSWGLATAEQARLEVVDSVGTPRAAVGVRLVSAAALVPSKLHALRSRRGATQAKRGSDAYDVYRLLAVLDEGGDVARALQAAPARLGTWCAEQIDELFVADAERTLTWMRAALAPGTLGVGADDLRAVGEPFVAEVESGGV